MPCDKGETRAQLQQKPFHLSQDGGLQVALAVAIGQAQEIEHVRVAEHHVGRHLPARAHVADLGLHNGFGLFGNGGAQVQLAGDALAQGANAPAFDAAQFCVVLALQGRFERQDFDEVAPAQVQRQRGNNLLVRKHLGKLHHAAQAAQAAQAERLPVLGDQLCRQRRHNLLAILGSPLLQHFLVDALAHVPIQHGLRSIGRLRNVRASLLDQATQFGQKMAGRGDVGHADGSGASGA
ncbi:hypothetical protein D3C72_1355870 [compost metagenome]